MKSVAVLFGVALTVWGFACVDIRPVEVVQEGDDSGSLAEITAGCFACMRAPNTPGPGCENEYQACNADPECAKAAQCAVDSNCLALDREHEVTCAVACIEEAGILSQSTGASQLLTNVDLCMQRVCKPVCPGYRN